MEHSDIQQATPEQQYAFFLETVAQEGIVWGLYDEQAEGWAVSESPDQAERMVLWPSLPMAAAHNEGAWKHFVPQGIDLEAFVSEWIDELEEMERGVSLMFDGESGLEVALPYLQRDLQEAKATVAAEVEDSSEGEA